MIVVEVLLELDAVYCIEMLFPANLLASTKRTTIKAGIKKP